MTNKKLEKPKKKALEFDDPRDNWQLGYNQACDDWEKYHEAKVKEIDLKARIDEYERTPTARAFSAEQRIKERLELLKIELEPLERAEG